METARGGNRMRASPNRGPRSFARIMWKRIKGLWIQEVPDDIALCEFDCRKERAITTNGLTASGGFPKPAVSYNL